jgi:pimeloyl-ACP methyl ester carboxylesterase
MTLGPDPYKTAVWVATKYRLQPYIEDFVARFHADKETVILLAGGAASQLVRANKRFDEYATPDRYVFDPIWLDVGITVGDGKTLKISHEDDRDLDARVIVADRDIDFWLANIRPYEKAMKFFKDEFNPLLVAWDWRRNIQTAVDILNYVIEEIVRLIERTVPANEQRRAVKNIFLVGHSMGGMVAKLFFTQDQPIPQIGGMVSVGTPFYGYINQLRRIYEGEEELNRFYPAKTVAVIYSSLTGLYSLFPIDQGTFVRDGETIGLTSYPVTDENGNPADPFQKNSSPPYPSWFWYKELPAALELRQKLARPLPNNLSKAVFHLRTVKVNPATPVAARWNQKLPNPYHPGKSRSPIEIQFGRGDETIPHWSSRLASTPNENVHDFDRGEHSTLMSQEFILRKILDIVTGGKRSMTETEFIEKYGQNPEVATTEELAHFRHKCVKMPERYAWRILQNSLM